MSSARSGTVSRVFMDGITVIILVLYVISVGVGVILVVRSRTKGKYRLAARIVGIVLIALPVLLYLSSFLPY